MVNPCCGLSLQKATRNIAIIDLVICVISATIRLVVFDIQEFSEFDREGVVETVGADTLQTFRVNLTVGLNQIEEGHVSLKKEEPLGKDTQYSKSKPQVTTSKPKRKNSTSQPAIVALKLEQENQKFHLISMAVISFVVFICYVVLEIWLYRLLSGASDNRDSFDCKRWFWIRLTLTVFGFIFGMFGMVTGKFMWIEWLLEPTTLYRAYELYVVNEFRKEIVATSGIVRQRT